MTLEVIVKAGFLMMTVSFVCMVAFCVFYYHQWQEETQKRNEMLQEQIEFCERFDNSIITTEDGEQFRYTCTVELRLSAPAVSAALRG